MRKLVAGLVLVGVLILSGCGMYGRPTDTREIENFRKFIETCEDAGGVLNEGPRDWYTCDMGGAR